MNIGIFSVRSNTTPVMTMGFLGVPTPVGMPNQPVSFDPDAAIYLRAVEAADQQPLELAVALAINAFVVGCKGDGIWNAFKATCLLCGARTIAGLSIPLVGPTPTFTNVTAAKYDRAVGVIGNGLTTIINTNRANNADPSAGKHVAVWRTSDVVAFANANGQQYLSSINSTSNTAVGGDTNLGRLNNSYIVRVNGQGGVGSATLGVSAINTAGRGFLRNNGSVTGAGFLGAIRPLNGTVLGIAGMTQVLIGSQNMYLPGNPPVAAPTSTSIRIFGSPNTGAGRSASRISFYSIGGFLSLPALSARVEKLMLDLELALNLPNGLTRHSSMVNTGNEAGATFDPSFAPYVSTRNDQS